MSLVMLNIHKKKLFARREKLIVLIKITYQIAEIKLTQMIKQVVWSKCIYSRQGTTLAQLII